MIGAAAFGGGAMAARVSLPCNHAEEGWAVRLRGLVALWMLVLLPCGSWADEIGPAQAQSLQQQLRDWLTGFSGGSLKGSELPFVITGQHDHYTIRWALPGLTSSSGEAGATANVRPLAGGRWSIDDVTFPAAGAFSVTMPDTERSAPVKVQFSIGRQATHGLIDPGFASASSLRTELGDIVIRSESAKQHQEQRVDRYLAEAKVTPGGGALLDVALEMASDGWKSATQTDGSAPVAIGVQTVRATGRIKGLNRQRLGPLFAATSGLIGALPRDFQSDGTRSRLPAAVLIQARLLVEALQDILVAVDFADTFDGVQVEVAGLGGASIKRFSLGLGGAAPDGRLHTWIDVSLDDLASPSLPPTLAALLPRHVQIKPSLSGVLTTDLHKLMLDAIAENTGRDQLAPDIEAIFSHGGVDVGVESLGFDLGPAKVAGIGHVAVLSPGTWHGEAHLVATGFDELSARAQANPDLARVLPVLIMLRGLAKPEGDHLVWDVVSDGPRLTVNGLELSELGGGKPRTKPPRRGP
jgi:hypothetical protein